MKILRPHRINDSKVESTLDKVISVTNGMIVSSLNGRVASFSASDLEEKMSKAIPETEDDDVPSYKKITKMYKCKGWKTKYHDGWMTFIIRKKLYKNCFLQ